MPLESRRGDEESEADLTTTHEAMGRREAVSGGSSKIYLDGEMGWRVNRTKGKDVLCGVVVVLLDLLQLEVDKVLGIEGALVRDFGFDRGGGGGRVKVSAQRETWREQLEWEGTNRQR